jgi:DNA-binding CsgD family transcriptional regulator
VLQDLFGFTPAELALATDILAGHDLAASAARRRITLHTARAHLRRLFEKTGTRRQAELMRLLLLCPQPVPTADYAQAEQVEFKSSHRSNG